MRNLVWTFNTLKSTLSVQGVSRGLGDKDSSASFLLQEERSGIEFRSKRQ